MSITISIVDPYKVGPVARLVSEWAGNIRLFKSQPDPAHIVPWISNIIRDGYVIKANNGDRLVGTAGMEVARVPWAPWEQYWVESFFCVTPGYMHNGVPEAMLTALKLKAARDNSTLMLTMFGSGDVGGANPVGSVYSFGSPEVA